MDTNPNNSVNQNESNNLDNNINYTNTYNSDFYANMKTIDQSNNNNTTRVNLYSDYNQYSCTTSNDSSTANSAYYYDQNSYINTAENSNENQNIDNIQNPYMANYASDFYAASNQNTDNTTVSDIGDLPNTNTLDFQDVSENVCSNADNGKKIKGINFKIAIAICLICCILSSVASSIITFSLMDNDDDTVISSNTSKDNEDKSTSKNDNNTDDKNTSILTPENSTTVNIGSTTTSPATLVAAKVSPSIVGIRVTTKESYGFYGEYESSSEGSGVIYTTDGYIITNYHVISEMLTYSGDRNQKAQLSVFLNQDTTKEHEAKVIGYDQASDLAVIKIEGTNLKAIEIGNSDNLTVGDIAIAIGNPGGLDFMGSITQGIISGLDRSVQTEESFEDLTLIQTDAAINPGNSGGALCNSDGKLIGINSVKLVETGYESMGFAIPVNDVIRICDNIIKNGSGENVYLGLEFNDVDYTSEFLESKGFPAGLVIVEVSYSSPAHKAGFETYDILVSFNNQSIESLDDLIKAKNECSAGDTVTARVYREIPGNSFFFRDPSYDYVDLEITFD